MMINDENKKSFFEMMKGRAVYLALGACVLAAGLISYSATKTKTPGVTDRQEPTTYIHINERVLPESTAPQLTTEAPTLTPVEAPPVTEAPTAPPETRAVFDNAADPLEPSSAEQTPLTFTLPLSGKIGKDYSMGVPVFSDTMGDYRTHNGVDFPAAAGAGVHAIAAGSVISVAKDALFGNTVTIDHGNGVVSAVSGLADEGLIYEGAQVYNETVIGVVGELPVEQADGSHIHLEIRVNGVLQDPLEVMGLSE